MKKRSILTFFHIFMVLFLFSQGTTYYVSTSGSDSNNGISVTTAFETIQKASDIIMPGDTVYIMNGTYYNTDPLASVVTISRSGTEDFPIVFTAYPGHEPHLRFNGWHGILIDGASHITLKGLRIEGNNDSISEAYALLEWSNLNNPLTGGSGIYIKHNPIDSVFPVNIVIQKNAIFNCGAFGIYYIHADRIHISENEIFNNCFFWPGGASAISQRRPRISDTDPKPKLRIEKNKIYNNTNLIPLYPLGEFVAGHAIEILNMFESGLSLCAYTGKTLISNNIIFNNGGAAISIHDSYSVSIYHNTIAYNSAHSQMWSPEIYLSEVYTIFVSSNIIYAANSLNAIQSSNTTNCWGNYNLYDGAWSNSLQGVGDVVTSTPGLTYLSDNHQLADFTLTLSSPAIDAAPCDTLVIDDFANSFRPIGGGCDIGAYEFDPNAALSFAYQAPEILLLIHVKLFDMMGRIIYSSHENSTNVFIPSIHNKGLYLLNYITSDNMSGSKKILF
jgi:hypothetical protein